MKKTKEMLKMKNGKIVTVKGAIIEKGEKEKRLKVAPPTSVHRSKKSYTRKLKHKGKAFDGN